ncbi:MAG: hypothetical protein ACK5XN_11030, partial [Bacteroidota bacterium]
MSSTEINTNDSGEQQVKFLTFKEIIFKYISNLPLFFFSLGASMLIAWSYLRWATPVYSVSASMMIKQEASANIKGNDKFSNLFEPVDKINMEDEKEFIKSKRFLEKVVYALQLNNNYTEHGKVRSSEVYKFLSVIVQPVSIKDSSQGYSFDFQVVGQNGFILGKETKIRPFYSNIEKGGSIFRVIPINKDDPFFNGRRITYRWIPAGNIAGQIASDLTMTQGGRSSSVLTLSLKTLNTEKGLDILNQIMKEYETYNVKDKSRISNNTLSFINDRLDKLEEELGIVEVNLQQFKKLNQFIDLEKQSEVYMDKMTVNEDNLNKQDIQIS